MAKSTEGQAMKSRGLDESHRNTSERIEEEHTQES